MKNDMNVFGLQPLWAVLSEMCGLVEGIHIGADV